MSLGGFTISSGGDEVHEVSAVLESPGRSGDGDALMGGVGGERGHGETTQRNGSAWKKERCRPGTAGRVGQVFGFHRVRT